MDELISKEELKFFPESLNEINLRLIDITRGTFSQINSPGMNTKFKWGVSAINPCTIVINISMKKAGAFFQYKRNAFKQAEAYY
jgi:hypothetical protein